jgi:UDPglucose--hexose-1-phosphate uridylyltransferase
VKATKTSTRLADGRELLFYDERADRNRDQQDMRDLRPTSTSSELRYDSLLDEWVIVAAHRQSRTHLPPAELCPLCPTTPTHQTEIPAPDYDVVVFENRFPSLTPDATGPTDSGGLHRRRAGVGRCEVVSFTPDHGGSFGGLPRERMRTVIDVWADRNEALGALPGVEQVFPFENRGEEIGVTLHHPHGQIYAYPFITPTTQRVLAASQRYREQHGGCLSCAIVDQESDTARVVSSAPGWVAFVPYAARWPFQVHAYPTRHLADLTALDDGERDGLVVLLKDVLGRYDGLFDMPMPYMATWHQAPVHTGRDLAHLRLEIISSRRAANKLKFLASSESAAGVFINDISPELAAELLRAVGD